jgi:hypothetical protein
MQVLISATIFYIRLANIFVLPHINLQAKLTHLIRKQYVINVTLLSNCVRLAANKRLIFVGKHSFI